MISYMSVQISMQKFVCIDFFDADIEAFPQRIQFLFRQLIKMVVLQFISVNLVVKFLLASKVLLLDFSSQYKFADVTKFVILCKFFSYNQILRLIIVIPDTMVVKLDH